MTTLEFVAHETTPAPPAELKMTHRDFAWHRMDTDKNLSVAVTLHALFSAAISLAALSTQAALPLTVEDLITEKGKVKLEASLVYANHDRQGVSMGEPITIQTGPTSFVNLPTVVGESHTNSDSLVGTIGLHYGVTGKVEIYARSSFLHNSSRISGVLGTSNINETKGKDDVKAIAELSEIRAVES